MTRKAPGLVRAYIFLFGVGAAVAGLDQLGKAAITARFAMGESIAVIPGFFNLVYYQNRGAAFGILNRSDIEWQFWLFLIATAVAIWAILFLAAQSRNQPAMLAGLGLILGGAIGNLVDRLRHNAVTDFLDFYWNGWHWPAFNIADAAICAGVGLVCLASFRSRKKTDTAR